MQNKTVTFLPSGNKIEVSANELTIKDAAKLAGVLIELQCGGKGHCGKCRVTVAGENIPSTALEKKFISKTDLEKGIRLACQSKVSADITVTIPKKLQPDKKKLFISAIPAVLNAQHVSDSLGVAIDIGTTTIVGVLVDLKTNKTLSVYALTNPQAVHGADVISRINYVINTSNGLKLLQSKTIETINEIIEHICLELKKKPETITNISVCGNTTMQHFFIGEDPRSLSVAPYQPPIRGVYKKFNAIKLGLKANPEAEVYLIPNIAGWVGGDTVGVVLATEMHKSKKIKLAIDIGTNGEMVLGSKDKMSSASTAAGPCFEGARISCGMRAADGAIESVYIAEDGIFWRVIGRVKAVGICGSALIDTVAELLKFGIIDETGRIQTKAELEGKVPEVLLKSLIENESGNSFQITENIIVTQRDVRELQLAKAAIHAGIQVLISEMKIKSADIDEILLAGTFGNYIDKANAQRIGLIPDFALEKVRYVGNAACEGARLVLISDKAKKEAESVAGFVNYVELSARNDFQDAFVESMMFKRQQ
ncbi:MAG: hypothetical protein A2252_04980 [Elusimicrobia bacterium RIFOXYA2_FULL_39_19]|nr:MAG: hypothetical protein A2252_04980 [Elusimicrobia bacterium RIFOXYA2_FULL_39_19]